VNRDRGARHRSRNPGARRAFPGPAMSPAGRSMANSAAAKLLKQPMVLVCGSVGIDALSEAERREIYKLIDVTGAIAMVADLQAKLDIATTTDWNTRRIELQLLNGVHGAWTARARAQIMKQDRLVSPQASMQLLRELLESDVTDQGEQLDHGTLVRLLLSIHTEQQSRPEFGADVPSRREIDRLAEEISAFDEAQMLTRLRELLPDQAAAMLFNAPLKLEVAHANAINIWFAPWPDKVNESRFGRSPAEAFKEATGVDLADLLHLGHLITDVKKPARVVFTRRELVDAGASEQAVAYLAEHMSRDLAELQDALGEDRLRGSVAHQRFTLTRFPLLRQPGDTFVMLRHQWAADRLFGALLYWDAYSGFGDESRRLGARFSEAMDHMFEKQVGLALGRIAKRSSAIEQVIDEAQLQEQWAERAGEPPSVCDWVIPAGKACFVIDATNHPLNFSIAQGLATSDDYEADMDKIFTNKKFDQLAQTMRQLRQRGWEGSSIGSETSYVPIVVVPDTGVPRTTFTEIDLRVRAQPIFQDFLGYVTAPTVLSMSDLLLLEGIAEWYTQLDFVQVIGSWRQVSAKVPMTLQQFLDSVGMQRPLPRHVLDSHKRFIKMIGSGSRPA
jgi:hypothetical protein